jgi:hypothetical protein
MPAGAQVNYLISGLAKSGTTILFSRLLGALPPGVATCFEPDDDAALREILAEGAQRDTLTKVLIGRVKPDNTPLREFDRHVVIYRDPRDQFISMLLYLFYDFQLSNDIAGYRSALDALEAKVMSPRAHSTIALYNHVAKLVGRAPINVFNNLHRVQRDYIRAFSPCLLRYEDFIDGHLAGVETYLGLDLGNRAEVAGDYRRVARSRSYGEWRRWLNDEDLAYIQSEWGDTLAALGYPACRRAQGLAIERSTSLDYVSQFNPSRPREDTTTAPG